MLQCLDCGSTGPKKLHAHHLDGNRKNSNPENLIVLCSSCHIGGRHSGRGGGTQMPVHFLLPEKKRKSYEARRDILLQKLEGRLGVLEERHRQQCQLLEVRHEQEITLLERKHAQQKQALEGKYGVRIENLRREFKLPNTNHVPLSSYPRPIWTLPSLSYLKPKTKELTS